MSRVLEYLGLGRPETASRTWGWPSALLVLAAITLIGSIVRDDFLSKTGLGLLTLLFSWSSIWLRGRNGDKSKRL